jgi:hypothetical protein
MVENRTGINKILLDLEEEGNCLQMHAAFTINRYLQNAYYFHRPGSAFLARLCVLGDPGSISERASFGCTTLYFLTPFS